MQRHTPMSAVIRAARVVALAAVALAPLPGVAQTPAAGGVNLAAVKSYLVEMVGKSKAGTAELADLAQRYYDLAAAVDFNYETLWEQHGEEVETLLAEARQTWVEEASANYELSEGLVAGVPSLAYFDVWIDAGPSGADDPVNALDIQITLPDGRVLDRPGNLYHYVTEPVLWGTDDAAVGLRVDMDGDGEIELGEALPEANRLLGSAQALDAATGELQTAAAAWAPTLSDAFTALVVMIPTMSGYFEEWKGSVFVAGDATDEVRFVGVSRLADIVGILSGLEIAYETVRPAVEAADPAMAVQAETELRALREFVAALHQQELDGTRFSPAQADQFGAELQSRATATAGQIAQAAALLEVPLADE